MVDCKICGHPFCSYAGVQRGIVVECANYMPKKKPQTNADRHRAMSDEEWAAVLEKGGFCPRPFAGSQFCVQHTRCKNCCLDYLRQPVKDGDNG